MLKTIINGLKSSKTFVSKNINEAAGDYKSEMISIFNKAIRDELGSAISYKAMAEKISGAGNSKLREELAEHGVEEFEHFNELIEYAATHGILNELTIDIDESVIVNAPSDVQGMIDFSQNLETLAISDYTAAAKLAHKNGDFETFEFFRDLSSDEEGHYDDIAVYTGKTRSFGGGI